MSDKRKNKTEGRYTTVAALLVGALLWDIIALMAPSRHADSIAISAALLWNAACVLTAWFSWKRSARFFNLSIISGGKRPAPSIEASAQQ